MTEVGRPLWQAVILAGAMDPVRSPELRGAEAATVNLLREIIAEGQKNGEVTRDFPVVHLAEFMEGLFNTVVRQWAVDLTGPAQTHRARAQCGGIFLAGRATVTADHLQAGAAVAEVLRLFRETTSNPSFVEAQIMKAAVLREFKAPLSIEEIAQPQPGAHEVLIEVEACGVCHSDLHLADADWPQLVRIIKKPLILGHEIAGRVVEKGACR